MKNRLLALMALCGATSSTMPLWASENWPDPTLSFVDPNLTQDETGGGVYYIYHVATQKFMVNGNYKDTWGTELVVGDEGQEVTLSYGEDYELARRPESDPDRTTAKGWRLSMMVVIMNFSSARLPWLFVWIILSRGIFYGKSRNKMMAITVSRFWMKTPSSV